ncbi:nucleolar complex protein 3 homolog [Scyliorhinus canicula]|uniref:nucleolar complex protein 3 homolog n=1 Tax=Scyliorhinus canicula TaxID=7830 RepID=UPI0018F2B0F6|nr:nucleolar complex protein 3 homolog [Scyliorhinus canicula]
MGPRKNTKRVPNFRRLLKTSSVKLANKLKNKQYKQQSVAKKYKKEQKQLRQAARDVSAKTGTPLDQVKRKRQDEEEDEMEEDVLPLDMLEDDDLEYMQSMGQRALFLSRNLHSSEPIHAKKRKNENVVEHYEKLPRYLQTEPEKELIHLLPIKDKRGIIPQSIERPILVKEGEDEEMTDENQQHEEGKETVARKEPLRILTTEELLLLRRKTLQEKKIHIATLASSILTEPDNNIKKLKELRSMLMETDPNVAVTVRKLVMVSLLEVFKDITPCYRIRPLTEAEKTAKVRKETLQLRGFEEGLVCQYKFYLENLEQTVKDWKQMKKKKSDVVSLKAYKGLAEVAVKCLCELLVALPHFNFHNNIAVMIVPLMNDASRKISEMCCGAVETLFKQDKIGVPSLAMVKIISGLVKSRNYEVKSEVLKTFLALRIKEVEVKKDSEAIAPKKRFMTCKEKRKHLSRMQRKWKKAEEKLEKELLETEASESKDKKLKLHTDILNIVFLTYFRILKKAQKSLLLPGVLEGLAKFAHLINVEFFDDLLVVLYSLIDSGTLNYRECFHCIQAAFHVLSGQGDVLNIDPMKFYTHLYKMLFALHAGDTNEDVLIMLQCIDVMLTKRRKQVSLQRAIAYVKRLTILALNVLPNSTIGILATNRVLMNSFPKTDILLDNESHGSGLYLPELDEPEYCNAQNTVLWELHYLQRHFHPVVRRFAAHISVGAPSEGSGALRAELSRKHATELFEEFSMKEMTFNPPITSSGPSKKKSAMQSAFLDSDLQRQINRLLEIPSITADLKFAEDFKVESHT